MRKRAAVLAFLGLLLPEALRAEGLGIEHRSVGCVVAGQYPRLDACFTPASRLARARVFFRVAGSAPDWYFVEMTSDALCHAGVLPRPKKELVGRRIRYYVDALDRGLAESRTEEAEALVVSKASDCVPSLPVAAILRSAPVAVYPSLPAGFAVAAAGLGAGATAAIVTGGAMVVGGGVALAAFGSSEGPAPAPTTTTPPQTLPPITATTTTTTTTLPAVEFKPVFKVRKDGRVVQTNPVVGTEPLRLAFDMCESSGPYRLHFGVLVDGTLRTNGCRSFITFTTASAVPDAAAANVRSSLTSRSYAVVMAIVSDGPDNKPQAKHSRTVQVDSSGSGGASSVDGQGPAVTLTKPLGGSLDPGPFPYPLAPGQSSPSATFVSDLAVPGGAGQVVANGDAAFPRAGRSPFAVRVRPGENRIEATLVAARSGGTWRFELGGGADYRPETLRVVAGDVTRIDADSVTFRMRGRPGERVVFTFRAEAP